LGIPQASGGSKSELDEVDLGAAGASDATEDKRVVTGTETVGTNVVAAATWALTLLLLGFGEVDLLAVADTTTGATTTAALVCAEVTISPVAVGDAPV